MIRSGKKAMVNLSLMRKLVSSLKCIISHYKPLCCSQVTNSKQYKLLKTCSNIFPNLRIAEEVGLRNHTKKFSHLLRMGKNRALVMLNSIYEKKRECIQKYVCLRIFLSNSVSIASRKHPWRTYWQFCYRISNENKDLMDSSVLTFQKMKWNLRVNLVKCKTTHNRNVPKNFKL